MLVCDEVGYLTYGPDAANVLYHVVTKRYHATRAMIFTSNKHPSDWGAVLHDDDDLAVAIVDRVLERGHLLHLDGPRCAPSTSALMCRPLIQGSHRLPHKRFSRSEAGVKPRSAEEERRGQPWRPSRAKATS